LAPVVAALRRLAHEDAAEVLAAADGDVAKSRATADAEVARLLDLARARAEEDVAVLRARERSRAMRASRAMELRARRTAYEALVVAAGQAVRVRLAGDPDVADALARLARAELGRDAVLTRTTDGGLVAEAGDRRIVHHLSTLVEQAVADLVAAREEP
jgi:vacuolar-type H+-ATPase subunit E/Vma4